MSDLNIFQRMLSAMKEIGSLKKDRQNTHQGYWYLSEEAVKKGVHQALVKHGILFSLSATNHETTSRDGLNNQNKPIVTTFSNMTFVWTFTNVDKPEEKITGEWRSAAADNSDKSHTKAITYAIREIFKSQFVISTGELDSDPDGDTPEVAPVARKSTKKQHETITDFCLMDGKPKPQQEWLENLSEDQAVKLIKKFEEENFPKI